LLGNGRVVTWGNDRYGGDSSEVQDDIKRHGVKQIYSNEMAFAALLGDGRMVAWGHDVFGGDIRGVQDELKMSGIKKICSTTRAFAALTTEGQLVTWGHHDHGGDSSAVQGEIKRHGVHEIYSTGFAFAALLKNDRVVTWGDNSWGGNSSEVQNEIKRHGVQKIYSNDNAFAALTKLDQLVVWGNVDAGGDMRDVQRLLEGQTVQNIYSTGRAFAALTTMGRVVAWGDPDWGGEIPLEVQGLLEGQELKKIHVHTQMDGFIAETVSGQLISLSLGRDLQVVVNIPNDRKIMDIIGNTIILDNWDVLAVNREYYSLRDDPNYLRFIRNRRLYTRAIKRTLLNAGDPEKVLEGPARSNQHAVLGNKDLRGLVITFLDVWRGGTEGEGE